jgi:NADH-quinone oxidoreductase subunit M
MSELHFPWLELSILIPLIGAVLVARVRDPVQARTWSVVASGLTLMTAFAAWEDFGLLNAKEADDAWHLLSRLFGREIFVIDQLSAPLLPLTALLYTLTIFTTLRTKLRRFSFPWTLVREAIMLATLSCKLPWLVILLLAAGTIPPFLELQARGQSTRVYALHMGLFVGLMVAGEAFVTLEGERVPSLLATVPLLAAVCVRSGMVPFHCWMTDLFEKSTFGTAILTTVPIAGAYAAVRLVLPIAPGWVLQSIGVISLVTSVYAAGMALVQKEGRRFFCYLFLSHSALVLSGLEMVNSIGLTGALCVWMTMILSLGGFGLTLRALEARRGRLSLMDFQGLYPHTPTLAVCFALTGLASVGFPGTAGFVGGELLVDGAVETYPYIGIAVVIAAALNGIAVVQAYFRLFTGKIHVSTVDLSIGQRERIAVLTLTALLFLGGLAPQFIVESRHHAAEELLRKRLSLKGESADPSAEHPEASLSEPRLSHD